MIPPIKKWRRMLNNNDTTNLLVEMSEWLMDWANEKRLPPATRTSIRKYICKFQGIALIHNAHGSIPMEVYEFRYKTMEGFLYLVRDLDKELFTIFNGCL